MVKKNSTEEAELLDALAANSVATDIKLDEADVQETQAASAATSTPAAEEPKKSDEPSFDPAAPSLSSVLAAVLNAANKAEATSAAVQKILDLQAALEARLAEADVKKAKLNEAEADVKKAKLNELAEAAQEAEAAYKAACSDVQAKDLARTRAWQALQAARGDGHLFDQLDRFLRHPIRTTQAVALANLKFEEADKATCEAIDERDRLYAEWEEAAEKLDIERSKA